MSDQKDLVLKQDIKKLLQSLDFMKEFENKTVFVTGATGLIGSQIVKLFAAYNRKAKEKIQILALVRSKEKAQHIFEEELEQGD